MTSDSSQKEMSAPQFLSGGGEMGKLIRSMDWSTTALGPVDDWPQSLRTSVSLCLSSTFPILIAWGPETIQLYNDSYRPICGAKHPESMGQNFRICWETALSVVGDAFTRGQEGEGTYIKDQRMFLDRYGYLEEAFMTFSFAPIRDESGNVGGIFHPITETTEKMLSGRRTQALRELGSQISKAKSIDEICDVTINRYDDYVLDLPFLLLYEVNAESSTAHLRGVAGLPAHTPLTPETIDLAQPGAHWPLTEATQGAATITELTRRFGTYSCAPYDNPPENALILPIHISGQEQPYGYLIAGVSACRALDQEYYTFYELLINTYNTAVSNVYAYAQEQKRAEALAAIDRSKTEFFSNVSHEFRTPLTLMLGPLEELIHQPLLQSPMFKDNIQSAHGNALRLLRLVNNLLDFSRVEADRVKAMYQSVDLAMLTSDLASSFRAIIEKVGMRLVVSCPPLRAPVYVDRAMWEKIVLNLLSNAFKYTLEGTIRVTLEQTNTHAVLKVLDTGIGIPEHELPHMFERFHRVAQNLGRTHEGTGIGLSLVSELANLHGGTIRVESKEGHGSTFIVTIPLGKQHLPQNLVSESESQVDTSTLKSAFLNEAQMLLDDGQEQPEGASAEDVSREHAVDQNIHILIVDDNHDMRAYLVRLLQPYFSLDTAGNGAVALEKVQTRRPTLIISDVMMPVMDGKEFLAHLRADARTADIPLIFLSARAGEEARIDGIEAGADDYLIKPFSAKELLSKVRVQLKTAKSRNYAEQQLRNLVLQAPVAIAIFKGADYIVTVANEMMLEIWNKDAAYVLHKPLLEVMPEFKAQGFQELMDAAYNGNTRMVTEEIPVKITRRGQIEDVFIKLTLEPLHDENQNAITGLMIVADEVTDLVMARIYAQENAHALEKIVTSRTEELSVSNKQLMRSNKELEQYAYVTSHDLQEPLRKIQVFTGMLEKMPALPEPALQILSRITASATRMRALVQDLLSFSRLLNNADDKHPMDLNEALAYAISDFDLLIAETGATIETDTLPTIPGIAVQMNQLFSNLLSNALKFRNQQVRPEISIRSRTISQAEVIALAPEYASSTFYEISMEDNGIGFDKRYAEKIFRIFSRLHVATEGYSGSGIGLALCNKIVQNHNGWIVADSEEGVGSTIRVILPA